MNSSESYAPQSTGMSDQTDPLVEYEPDRKAVIEPSRRSLSPDLPAYCVLPMYSSVLEKLSLDGRLKPVYTFKTPFVDLDVFVLDFADREVTAVGPEICQR
jgi:hypothetical protein